MLNQTLYSYYGDSLVVNEQIIDAYHSVELRSEFETPTINILAETNRAYADFQDIQFGR